MINFFNSKQKDDVISFKHSSIILRLFNFCIACFILVSNILGFKNGDYSIVAMCIGLFCLSISCYQNLWIFNLNNKTIINKKGIFIFGKNDLYVFSEISAILIEKYERTGKRSEYTQISIQFKDGEEQVIENDKTKRLKDEIILAQELQRIISSSN